MTLQLYSPIQGFFRRSVQRNLEYGCLRDSKCLVIRLNRNRCQACRFTKCLAAGMSKESVRYGRTCIGGGVEAVKLEETKELTRCLEMAFTAHCLVTREAKAVTLTGKLALWQELARSVIT